MYTYKLEDENIGDYLDPDLKISAARYKACEQVPYFSVALFSLIPFRSIQIPTMAVTDDGLLIYNPFFLAQVTTDELAWVLVHEVCHVLRECSTEFREHGFSTDPKSLAIWNIAADFGVNHDITDIGLPEVKGALHSANYDLPEGLTTFQYYNLINNTEGNDKLDDLIDQMTKQKKGGESQEGDGESQEGDGVGGRPALPGAGGQCGGAAGNPLEGEDQQNQTSKETTDKLGLEERPEGRSEAFMESVRQQVADDIRQAVEAQSREKGRGNIPKGFVVWSNAKLAPPKVNWRSRLRFAVRNALRSKPGKLDYTYTRRSRRQGCFHGEKQTPMLPGMYQPVPKIAVAVDTSGSMGFEEGSRAIAEISGVIRSCGSAVTLYACDCNVMDPVVVEKWGDIKKHMIGGGGTDFRPVFKAIESKKNKPNVLIFVTDGDGPAPAEPPKGVKVFWVIVGSDGRKPYTTSGVEIDYGTFIEVL